ncbi:MAG: hypothetical protein GX868_14125 [Actinobacteria bacterium]|nr:hypothetical protein [Actinomycetota bacterium]
MIPRQEPLDGPAILFGDRGASGLSAENTLEGFQLALRLGATGIETDLLSTADGVPLLRRSPKTSGFRKKWIADSDRASLGDSVVSLEDFYVHAGTEAHVLVHVGAVGAVEAAVQTATRFRALERLWLASSDLDDLAAWRQRSSLVRLVHEAPIATIDGGAERHAATLRSLKIDAVLAPRTHWNGGRTALYHRFRRRCFGNEAVHERMAVTLLHIGLDGVSSGYPDRLVDAVNEVSRPDAPEFREQ